MACLSAQLQHAEHEKLAAQATADACQLRLQQMQEVAAAADQDRRTAIADMAQQLDTASAEVAAARASVGQCEARAAAARLSCEKLQEQAAEWEARACAAEERVQQLQLQEQVAEDHRLLLLLRVLCVTASTG